MAPSVSVIIKLGPEAKSERIGRAGEGRWEKLPESKDEALQQEINTQQFHQPLYPSSAPVFPHDPTLYVKVIHGPDATRYLLQADFFRGTICLSHFTYGLLIHVTEPCPGSSQ